MADAEHVTDFLKVETHFLNLHGKMNCPICFEDNDMYTMTCGHHICHLCEINMRVAATPTHLGRFIQCPLCRAVETSQDKRSTQSYEAELALMYAPKRQRPRAPRAPEITWAAIGIMFSLCFYSVMTAFIVFTT